LTLNECLMLSDGVNERSKYQDLLHLSYSTARLTAEQLQATFAFCRKHRQKKQAISPAKPMSEKNALAAQLDKGFQECLR